MPGIPSVIKSVSFDAADALALARFWAAVLGSDVDEDSTAGKAFVEAAGWGGPTIWFTQVPEPKTAKNRVHFDLRAPGAMEDEVARLERLGAAVTRRYPDHVVMTDLEGNEFCVETRPAQPPGGDARWPSDHFGRADHEAAGGDKAPGQSLVRDVERGPVLGHRDR